jgi:hypothetical protein
MIGHVEEPFHKDSIWCMDVTKDFMYVYTGGRDGSIYEVDIISERYKQIMGGSKDQPIISLKLDEANN